VFRKSAFKNAFEHPHPRQTCGCDVCNVDDNRNPSAGGFGGMNKCPPGKQARQMCTVHNLDSLFYCDACGHARPDLDANALLIRARCLPRSVNRSVSGGACAFWALF
jgi:hypothetical protein